MTGRDRSRESVERARIVVPTGEVLRGEHMVAPAHRAPRAGYFRRPRSLRSERRTLWSWCWLPVYGVARIASITWNPFEALFEALMDREGKSRGKPFHGGWGSMAGQLAKALLPRTKNGAHVVMQVTDSQLRLVYVSGAGGITGRHGPVEIGWAADLRDVAWVRDRSDVMGGDHEIGFVDGSWYTVRFAGQGWRRMSDAFPVRLSHLDPVPHL